MKIINFDKNKMTLLLLEKNKSHLTRKIYFIRQEKYESNNGINYYKIRDYCHYTRK